MKQPSYNYEIAKESRDCDGPMDYPRQEKNDVSHDGLHRALGQFILGYQHIAYAESQSPGCIVLHGYSKTDEGSASGSFVFWEVI